MADSMKITVLNIRLQNSGRPLKAFIDIALEDLIIRDFRIIKENGKRLVVACPQASWKDRAGLIKYKTLITFPDDVKGELDIAILSAYRRAMETQNEKAF